MCCQEVDIVEAKLTYIEPISGTHKTLTCITLHPGFKSVCLDVWTLQVAYLAYRQEHGHYEEERTHK